MRSGFSRTYRATRPSLISSNDIMQTFVCLLLLAAQPGGDLIQRYVEAIGGEEALRASPTRVTTGRVPTTAAGW